MAAYYLHKEGTNSIIWVTLLMFLTGAMAFMEGGRHWILWPLWIACLFIWGLVVFFFRIPRREYPGTDAESLLSPADEPYILERTEGEFGPYTVPEDSYFMMGDNRNRSVDSRYWDNQFVEKNKILGKVVLRYYKGFKWIS